RVIYVSGLDGFPQDGPLSPDGRTLLVACRGRPGALGRAADWLGWAWLAALVPNHWGLLLDAADGRELGVVPGDVSDAHWSPDGRSVAVIANGETVQVWDVPPRKPLAWFAAGVGLLAPPLAL